jgi:protein-disulfide isomerase
MASNSQLRQSRRQQLEAQRLAQAQKERKMRIMFVAAGVVVLALVAGFTVWGVSVATQGGQVVPPNANSGGNGIAMLSSNPAAPTLDIFADYGCHVCKSAHQTLGAYLDQATESGDLNVVIHSTSNFAISRHANIAAACADVQGVFAAYQDQLYSLQDSTITNEGLDDNVLRSTIPATIGLTGQALTDFQSCFDSADTGKFVSAQAKYAIEEKVTGTPTFKMNGQDIGASIYNQATGAYDADLLRVVVENNGATLNA